VSKNLQRGFQGAGEQDAAASLFRPAGLEDVAAVPQVVTIPSLAAYRRLVGGTLEAAVRAGDLTSGDLARWWESLADFEREGGVLVVNLGFVVQGRRPQRLEPWSGHGESREKP
jgi:hypothetical protein